MIDVTFKLNNVDWSTKLSTYQVIIDNEYPVVITTMDGTEHVYKRKRPSVQFSLIPLTDAEVKSLYDCLVSHSVSVEYTNPYTNTDVTANMRVTSNLLNAFGLSSIDGNRYYKGTEIMMRQLTIT